MIRTPNLSIVIPSILERVELLSKLVTSLAGQEDSDKCEIISVLDNRKVPLAHKRNSMMRLATGRYIVHLDDDDFVADDFIPVLNEACKRDVDVVCFDQEASLGRGNSFIVRTSLEFNNEESREIDGKWVDITRKPWHWCAWNRRLALSTKFTRSDYGEDWFWLQKCIEKAKTEYRVGRVLHYYRWSPQTTTF